MSLVRLGGQPFQNKGLTHTTPPTFFVAIGVFETFSYWFTVFETLSLRVAWACKKDVSCKNFHSQGSLFLRAEKVATCHNSNQQLDRAFLFCILLLWWVIKIGYKKFTSFEMPCVSQTLNLSRTKVELCNTKKTWLLLVFSPRKKNV